MSFAVNSATAVSLTADNQAVDPGGNSCVAITSDDTTAANRTFTLATGGDGQEVTLVLVSGGATTAQLADGGNCVLSAAWEPLQGDTLQLVYYGSSWYEVSRSDN